MSEQKICKRAHRYGNVIAIATIRLVADFVASNGFQFGKLFFPADILHQLPAWRSVGERDSTTRNRMFSIRPFTSYPDFAEHVIEITFRSLKREIADINLLCHLSSLFLWTELRVRDHRLRLRLPHHRAHPEKTVFDFPRLLCWTDAVILQ